MQKATGFGTSWWPLESNFSTLMMSGARRWGKNNWPGSRGMDYRFLSSLKKNLLGGLAVTEQKEKRMIAWKGNGEKEIFIFLLIYTKGKWAESGSQDHCIGESLGRARFCTRQAGSEQRTRLEEKEIDQDMSRKAEKVTHPQALIVHLGARHCLFH